MKDNNTKIIRDEDKNIAEWRDWVQVECASAACRGKRSGVAHLVWIKKSLLADYEAGKYWPFCSECISK